MNKQISNTFYDQMDFYLDTTNFIKCHKHFKYFRKIILAIKGNV